MDLLNFFIGLRMSRIGSSRSVFSCGRLFLGLPSSSLDQSVAWSSAPAALLKSWSPAIVSKLSTTTTLR